jgi:hypothetical protein
MNYLYVNLFLAIPPRPLRPQRLIPNTDQENRRGRRGGQPFGDTDHLAWASPGAALRVLCGPLRLCAEYWVLLLNTQRKGAKDRKAREGYYAFNMDTFNRPACRDADRKLE